MTDKEALKLALEALDTVMWHGGGSCWVVDADKIENAITAIKEVAAEPGAFYGFPYGSVSELNASCKCVTAGETASHV